MKGSATSLFESPLGYLGIREENGSITEIRFLEDLNSWKQENRDQNLTTLCKKELDEYFKGERESFTVPLDPSGTEFEKQVWKELEKIPYGRTISYEELALRLGDPKKIRAAGRANGKNPIPILIPCHRVIGKNGSLVGFAGGLARKEDLLVHEGVINKQTEIF